MSFTRVNPGGWSTGAKVTSAQANQLDSDHANALDKTSAGDTLSGVVSISGSGSIHSTVTSGIVSSALAGISASSAGGISSGVIGGIELTAGSSDWVTFGSVRSRTIKQPLVVPFLNTPSWSVGFAGAPNVVGTNGSGAQPFAITQLHNGATLTSVKCFLCVNGPHSQLPSQMPQMTVYRRTIVAGVTNSSSLTSLGSAFASAASASAWDNSNQMQSWSVSVSSVIDTSQYVYYISIIDESGTGAVAGNIYEGFELTYSSIANMQFP